MRRHLILMTAIGLMTGSLARAQDKTVPKHDARVLRESLREVINAGADLFNVQGDHAGCYRLYQGSLLAIRPVLPADLQAAITQSLRSAERLPRYSDKAFELRKAIDAVRDWSDGGADGKAETVVTPKKGGVAKAPGKKGEADGAHLVGKVTFQGQPAPPGFITLVGKGGRRFSASILPDGTYQFKTALPPGEYRVAIERTPGAEIPKKLDIPDRYRQEATSGLSARIERGKQTLDFDLVR
jgi:hypothetical protein